MSTLRWKTMALVCGLFALLIGPAVAAGAATVGSGSLVEGLIVDFTGSNSFIGPAQEASVYPALTCINDAGGVLGHKFALKTADTRSDPADAVPVVEQFLATTRNLIGVTGIATEVAPTVVPLVEAAKVPINLAAGNSIYDHTTNPYIWRAVAPDSANGEAMAIYAHQHKIKSVALVFGTDASSQGDLPGVLVAVKALGIKVTINLGLQPDQASYRTDVEKVISSHPQAIMTESDGPTAATFFSEMKQLTNKVPSIIGTQITYANTWYGPVGKALGASFFKDHVVAVQGAQPPSSGAAIAAKKACTTQAIKAGDPMNASAASSPFSYTSYDGVMIQALAMLAAHSVQPPVFNKYILSVTAPGKGKVVVHTFAQGKSALARGEQIQYVGASGPIIFDKWHNAFGPQTVISYSPVTGNLHVVETISEKQIAAVKEKGSIQ